MVRQSIGALWEKKGRSTYWSGNIEVNGEKLQIVVFRNDKKTEKRFPDYRIFKAKEKESVKKIETIKEPY